MLRYTLHNHTYRCKHAIGSEEDMIKQAIDFGFEVIGISDHVPYPITETMYRMEYAERDEHLDILMRLKNKYSNETIRIYRGFEAEYQECYVEYLVNLFKEDKIDYLAMGQHYYDVSQPITYYGDIIDSKDIKRYVDQCISGMKTGLFLFVAHPDIFLNYIDKFDEECFKQSNRLIDAAIKYNVLLEYNAGGLRTLAHKQNDAYPRKEFWEIVAQKKAKALVNADAHTPLQIKDKYYKDALRNAKKLNLNIISNIDIEDYKKRILSKY